MGHTPWQRRIRRAEYLAAEHPFAAELLGFYLHIARFQEGLQQRLERNSAAAPLHIDWSSRLLPAPQDAGDANPYSSELLSSFPLFLSVVEERAPVFLCQVAHEVHSSPASWPDLLNHCWTASDEPPAHPQEFLAFGFLQPYAEFIRARAALQVESYTAALCPFCHRKPALGVLRQQGDGGRRSLICGFCVTEWEFRRIVCPGCGQEDHAKLPVYTAESLPHIRVECCDTCRTYLNSVDLTKNGLAEPLVDELASIPLNLWAQERGYTKLHPNLLGM